MSDFMQKVLESSALAAPPWLRDWQAQGRAQWGGGVLPNRKVEAWKYTNLQPLQQSFALPVAVASASLVNSIDIPRLEGISLVFVDGVFREELSSGELPQGLTLIRFADANGDQAARIRQQLGSAIRQGRHVFTSLNDATLVEGVFLEVAPNAIIDTPIQINWLTSGQPTAEGITQRLLLNAGVNSSAEVVEVFANRAAGSGAFTNGITELLLESDAKLHYHRLHLEEGAALHIGGVHARLADNASLNSFHLAFGSALKRIDAVVDLQGEGAHCELDGIYLPRGDEQVDYHTCIEHAVPNCSSSETFRGVVGGEASAIFNGRIHIHPHAQKSRAEMSNKNLLTSDKAEVNTKPELEIYADDVICSHGATVAQIDANTLHYLRSRGISQGEAEVVLSFGFINELLERLRDEKLQDYLKHRVAARFADSPSLTRHIL